LDGHLNDYEIGRPCSAHGRDKKYIKVLVGKSEGKRLLGRPGRRWGSIKVDIKEKGMG
jgi:hypothetical protein